MGNYLSLSFPLCLFCFVLFCFWKTVCLQGSCGLIWSCSHSSLWSWHFVQIVIIIMSYLPDTSGKTDAWCQSGGWVCRHLGAEEDHHKLLRHWSNIAKWKHPGLWLKWSLCSQNSFKRSYTHNELKYVPVCCFGPVWWRLKGNLVRKSSSFKKRGSYLLSLWNPAGILVSLDQDLN